MPDPKYKTPNGQIVSETELKTKYGDRFESLVKDKTFSAIEEPLYKTPNGKYEVESVLKSKYGDKFQELITNKTFVLDSPQKKNSIGTVPKQNLDSNTEIPSSDGADSNITIGGGKFPKLEFKDKSKKQDVVPTTEQNIIAKDNAVANKERVLDIETVKKQSEADRLRVKQTVQDFRTQTELPEYRKKEIEQEINNEVNGVGLWNKINKAGNEFFNSIPRFLGGFGGEKNTEPLFEEKIQAKKDLLESGADLTNIKDSDILEMAKKIKYDRMIGSEKQSKINDYMESLSDYDKSLYDIDRIKTYKTISEKDKSLLKQRNIQQKIAEDIYEDFEIVKNQIQENTKNGIQPTEEQIVKYNSLQKNLIDEIKTLSSLDKQYTNNNKELGTVQEEYDVAKRRYGSLDNFLGRVNLASQDLAINLLSAGNYLTKTIGGLDKDLSNQAQMYLDNQKQRIQNEGEGLRKNISKVNNVEDFIDYATDLVATQLPNLAVTSTGTGGLVVLGSASAGDKYNEMVKSNLSGQTDYNDFQMFVSPFTHGLAEGFFENSTLNLLKQGKRVFQSAAKNEIGREMLKNSASKKAKEIASDYAKNVGSEMSSELATNVLQNLNKIVIEGDKSVSIFDNSGDVLKDAGTLAFMLKATPQVAVLATKPFMPKNQLKELDKNGKEIVSLLQKLGQNDVSEEVKTVIREQVNSLTEKNKTIINSTISDIDKMPKELYDKFVSLEKESSSIRIKAESIKNDKGLDAATKNNLLESLSNEYKAIEEDRSKILGGKMSVVESLPQEEQLRLKDLAVKQLLDENKNSHEANFTNEVITKRANEIYQNEKNTKFVADGTQGTKISQRSSQEELRGDTGVYSQEQDFRNRLGERIRETETQLKRPLDRFEIEDLEKTTAFKFAKENNLWVDDLHSLGNTSLRGGNENTLVLDKKNGVVYKSNNLFNSQNSIEQFFESINGHNEIFPDNKYTFVGFTGIENKGKTPYVEPIVKQEYITNTEQASQNDIDSLMESMGFEKVNNHTFKNDEYTVSDLRPRNVLKDSDGNIHVIDDVVRKNKRSENNGKNTKFVADGKQINETGTNQRNETRLDNGRTMESRSERGLVGKRAGSEAIYRTAEASNTAGSVSPILTIEEREELESRGLNPDWDKKKFKINLKEQAKKNGVWLDDTYLDDKIQLHDQKRDNTTENDVYLNPGGKTVTKVNNLAFVTDASYENNLTSFIDRIEAHNSLFPNNPINIIGYANNKHKETSVVMEQPYIDAERNATKEEISEYFEKEGFKLDGTRKWSNGHQVWSNGVYEIYDARPANVLKKRNVLYFFDTVPHSVEYMNQSKAKSNEATPGQNITTDGSVQSGTSVVESNGNAQPKDNQTENVSETVNDRAVQTKKVTIKGVSNKDADFDVDIDDKGSVVSIRSKSTGKSIDEFVEYTTKDKKTGKEVKRLKKNGTWSKAEAAALGIETMNQEKVRLKKELDDAIGNFEPSNEYEHALLALANGLKVSPETLQREVGNTDAKWATNYSSKTELPNIETASEQIWNNNQDLDQQEVRNALIDIINSYESPQKIREEILNIYKNKQLINEELELNAYYDSLSEQEFAMFEAIKAEEDYLSELSKEEQNKYFENEYEKNIPRTIGNRENKTSSVQERDGETKSTKQTGESENETGGRKKEPEKEPAEPKQPRGEVKYNEQASTQDRKTALITERIKPERKRPKNAPRKLPQIIFDVYTGLKTTLVYGRSRRKNSLGTYNPSNTLVKIRNAGDIDTVAHELGHALDDRFDIIGTIPSEKELTVLREIKWFRDRGGSNPPKGLSPAKQAAYLEREGVAEFIRAYVANPTQAKIIAPNLYAHFENSIDENTKNVLQKFSDDYLDFANASHGEQIISNIEASNLPNKNGFKEWLNSFKTDPKRFAITPFDKLNSHLFNSLGVANKAFYFIKDLSGQNSLLPEKNFELMSRLFSGINGKVNTILDKGLVDGKNDLIKDSKGEAMNLKWLMEPLDSTSEKTVYDDMDEVIKYLVAERTIEYAKKLGRFDNLTGIGAGLKTDFEVAQGHLNDFKTLKTSNQEKHDRIIEAARRYREFADGALKYAVDKGRISYELYKQIKESNEYYVALSRVTEISPNQEYEPKFGQGGNKLTSVKEVIKGVKGGTNHIQNPYISLLQNTVGIVKESDRNEVLRAFVEPLNKIRDMGDGKPVDFSQIAWLSQTSDINSRIIYVNGEAQRWQFVPEIFNSLTSIDAISDNFFINIASKPADLIRFTVTNFPVFALRNLTRDTVSRAIISRSNGSFNDLFHNATDRELFELYGGSQAGFYLADKESYKEKLSDSVKEITAKGGIILDPRYLYKGYKKLLSKGENVNRIAEFKSSYNKALAEGLDEYNAGLYAAYQSRDLLDFAVAGHTVRTLNRVIPFLNAGLQGLVRTKKAVSENPTSFAVKTALYTILPTIIFRAIVSAMGDDDEYEQFEPYQRDLYWNFKTPVTGDKWISIPKPFEQGLISSAVDRLISKSKGYERAFEGFGGTLSKSIMPYDESTMLGGIKPIIEVKSNYDFFRDRTIISPWEEGKLLDLRKGTKNASRISKGISDGFKQAGWEVDPRNIDHLIKGYTTYMGDWALSLGDLGVEDSRFKLNSTKSGFVKDIPVGNSVSVKAVNRLAKELGVFDRQDVKSLRDKIEKFYDSEDVEERKKLSTEIYEKAEKIRGKLEKKSDKIKGIE